VPLGAESNTIPLIAAADVARVAAALLEDAERPAEPFYRLIGAVPTVGEIVEVFGKALGVPLRYVNLGKDEWRQGALSQGGTPHTIEHLSRLWEAFSNAATDGFEITSTIQKLTGTPPETLREFLKETQSHLPHRLAPQHSHRPRPGQSRPAQQDPGSDT
jgi:uncharacterized protein YbjT (DUF2867 family)